MIIQPRTGLMGAVLGLALAGALGCEASLLAPGTSEARAERPVDGRVETFQEAQEERERREASVRAEEEID